ncbi:MAG TPA: alpha/beta fold hydrolase [Solirubrobacteraceae bacterium]|nr:alpha/beta fold hydrolase [Solirubrobacteraceae bacterium]
MTGHLRRTIAALIAIGACAPAATAQAQSAPCTDAELKGAQCRTVPVPLDHATPGGEQLQLQVATYPAKGARKGTIFFIPGGPGQSALPLAPTLAEGLQDVAPGYDLVFSDPRGTGTSAPLRCAALPGSTLPVTASIDEAGKKAAQCGAELGARRAHFSTYAQSRDIDAIRAALGVDKIIPFGVSYGGQVAGDYARRYPQRTQAVILDSPSPVEAIDAMAKLPTLAIPRVLRETCFPPGCQAIFGDPAELLATVVTALREKPLRGRVVLPTGRKRSLALTASDVYLLVRQSDADPALRTALPAALAAAADGDAAPMLRLAVGVTGGEPEDEEQEPDVNEVRFLATQCAEGRLPWAPESDPATREALLEQTLTAQPEAWEPFGPEALASSATALCVGWPATPHPPYVPSAGRGPDVPVLVLAGRDDLRTPLEDARRTAAQYPQATLVAVPNTGHSVLTTDVSGCAAEAVTAFLAGGTKPQCENTPLLPVAPPAFKTFRDVPTLSGDLPTTVERTAVAVDVTLRDLERQLLSLVLGGGSGNASVTARKLRIGGLRGGRMIVDEDRLRLLNYEVVPGVRVSASASLKEDGPSSMRLTVTGSGATGTVVVPEKGSSFRATLGGYTFTYRQNAVLG